MSADCRPLAIALMGPTAAGKTALALDWAHRYGGEIVSIDSALVYRGLDIGSAKPTKHEQATIAHHMLDLRDPWQPYSAAEFASEARLVIDAILARDHLPILVGGTGLYFRALLSGLAPMPQADPDMRAAICAEAATHGWTHLHAQLAQQDPQAAMRIDHTDAQRIQRALEVLRISGKPISAWQNESVHRALPCRVLKVIVAPRERAVLHARIEQRLDTMLQAGLLDEVQQLRALPPLRAMAQPLELPALRTVGYRQAWEHLDGASTPAEFRDRAIFATRQLAKRQLTWLRGQYDARWFDPDLERDRLTKALDQFLTGSTPRIAPASIWREVV